MSSLNKFDFPLPIRNLPSTKSPPKPDSMVNETKQKQNQEAIRRARYYWHMRNEHHNERDKVKSKQQRINKQHENEKKQKIKDQLQKKKLQLQKLQEQRKIAVKKHGSATENAKKLSQNIEMKRLKSQQNLKMQHEKQQQRFKNALMKAKSQTQLSEFHVNRELSVKRRQTNNLYRSRERLSASKYAVQKQAEDKILDQLKRQKNLQEIQEKFAESMKEKTGKIINFENTCYHNYDKKVIVLEDPQEQKIASPRQFQRNYRERKTLKSQQSQRNRQVSIQRGNQALKKLREGKEYKVYMEEMQGRQRKYNMERIQEGKINQLVQLFINFRGIKPETLRSLSKIKQKRAERQFEDIFLTPQNRKDMRITIENFPKEYSSTSRKTYVDEYRTRHTERTDSSIKRGKLSPKTYGNERNFKILNESDDQENTYSLPYNNKLHGIMQEKSTPEYHQNLFNSNQDQKNRQNSENKQTHKECAEIIPLDYSMTEDQNQYF